jgi:hypothetical protein
MSYTKIIQPAVKPILFAAFFVFTYLDVAAQEAETDTLLVNGIMHDNLVLHREADSLRQIIITLEQNKIILSREVDSLQSVILQLNQQLILKNNLNDSLLMERISLNRTILSLKQDILKCNTDMEAKAQLLRDRDFQLAKLEAEIKDLKNNAEIKQVKLEGQLDVHNTKLEAKDKEISYLQKSVEEKDRLVREKTDELTQYYREKDNSLKIIDSLARTLNQKELDFIKVSERLKIIESQYNDMVAKQTAATNKKKKIRFIQGVGLKNYRTPDWQLSLQSPNSSSANVIINKNGGNFEFDYITGVSLSMIDLSKEKGKFTYDAGLFVGFGGQNLFKNFYIGPSFKILDYFHVNAGANIAEYTQLQNGFKEGDLLTGSTSIPTVKEWKINLYLGFNVDFDLLASIPKKF